MKSKTSKYIGLFYIIATLAGVAGAIINGMRINKTVNHDAARVLIANEALSILVMAVAVVMIAILFTSKLREYNKTYAYAYLLLRSFEGIIFLGMTIATLMQIEVWQSDGSKMMEGIFIASINWMNVVSMIVFGFSALILYFMLTKYRMLPRFIALWGLIATIIYVITGFMGLYGIQINLEMFEAMMLAPLALNEMVMAVYLIFKGFKDE